MSIINLYTWNTLNAYRVIIVFIFRSRETLVFRDSGRETWSGVGCNFCRVCELVFLAYIDRCSRFSESVSSEWWTPVVLPHIVAHCFEGAGTRSAASFPNLSRPNPLRESCARPTRCPVRIVTGGAEADGVGCVLVSIRTGHGARRVWRFEDDCAPDAFRLLSRAEAVMSPLGFDGGPYHRRSRGTRRRRQSHETSENDAVSRYHY